MRTEWFAAFIAAAKWKSFSKASEQCHLTQPALAKQIKRLEEALGTELFVRSSKGVALTKTGELAFQRLQPVLAEIKAIQRDINACTKKAKVTLGTLASLATYYLPPKMTAIPEDELDVELVIGESSLGLFTMLQEGGVDAAVIDVGEMRHDYWVADLFTEPYRVIVPQGHRLSKYQSIAVTDLRDESWVLYPHECESRRFLEHLYATHGLSPTVAREVSFGDSILGFVAAGAGVTVAAELVAAHAERLGLVAVPLAGGCKAERTVSLVARSAVIGNAMLPYVCCDFSS